MVITLTERNIFGTFLFWENSFEEEKNFRSYRKCEWVLSIYILFEAKTKNLEVKVLQRMTSQEVTINIY